MVLIRFSDALKELAGHPGAQVHRSHWVAHGQAKRLLREKNRTMVELVDGRRLPSAAPISTTPGNSSASTRGLSTRTAGLPAQRRRSTSHGMPDPAPRRRCHGCHRGKRREPER